MKALLLLVLIGPPPVVPIPAQVLGPCPTITIHTEGVALVGAEGRVAATDDAEVIALNLAAHRFQAMARVMGIKRDYDLSSVEEEAFVKSDEIHVRLTTIWNQK